jgi:hypothetical protein
MMLNQLFGTEPYSFAAAKGDEDASQLDFDVHSRSLIPLCDETRTPKG